VQGAGIGKTDPRDSWVGVPYSEQQAREMAQRCGFEMRYDAGAGDQYYWLWYFKPRL